MIKYEVRRADGKLLFGHLSGASELGALVGFTLRFANTGAFHWDANCDNEGKLLGVEGDFTISLTKEPEV